MSTPLTSETIRQAPKALLHDHLDGGLRPSTVIELAATVGYEGLPSTDEADLAAWFRTAAHSGSLVRYLEPFAHTVAVMQTPDALHRVARECVEDLAADNVVYAEIRFAPELHLAGGLALNDVVEAVLAGFADGEAAVIGGLTVTETTRFRSGIPVLMNLPWVGRLFSQNTRTETKRDLLILVTPHILEDGPVPPAGR